MKGAILLSTLIPIISAHTRFTTLFVNSQSQGDGTCIRMDMDPDTTDNFIASFLTSTDMACGVQGDTPVNLTCPLKAGDSISLLHRVWTDGSKPELGAIDPSHLGSTAVYMKKLADAGSADPYSTSASGDGWFKIAFNGYDESSKQFGTQKMNANGGKVDATIPSDLPGGYYLVRSEILSLQFITDNKPAPQFYTGCAQVYVDNSKSGDVSAQTVSVPGYIDANTPALTYDVYASTLAAFPEFGPTIYGSVSARDVGNLAARSPRFTGNGFKHPKYNNVADGWTNLESDSDSDNSIDDTETTTDSSISVTTTGAAASTTASPHNNVMAASSSSSPSTSSSNPASTPQSTAVSSSSSSSSSSSGSTSSIVGTCPSNTVLIVANSCLTELPSWSDDTPGALPKCWAASKQCWDTSSNCWNNVSPAINTNDMNAGCHAWENKCNALDTWCHGGNLEGPPAWTGGNVNTSRMGKRDVARHIVAAKRRGLRR